MRVEDQSMDCVNDFCYLGSMMTSSLDDLKRRRGIAWSNFWKLEHIWQSQSVSPQSSDRLLLWQWHLATPDYDLLINSVATSAYRIMTRVKRLDKVRNTTVLASVFRQHLIHTLQAWQQKFIGHLVRSENSTYALYQPLHGNIRWGRARNNYILYIRKRTECDRWTVTAARVCLMWNLTEVIICFAMTS